MTDEITTLRQAEAWQERLESELDVLARDLAHLPFTTMVTPQMQPGTWAHGKRIDSNTMGFIAGPSQGAVHKPDKPGVVLIVAPDVARRLAKAG